MYLAVDIGGTKTLIAIFDANGVVQEKTKIPTPRSYDELLSSISEEAKNLARKHGELKSVGAAIPVPINYKDGTAKLIHKFGWEESNFGEDLGKLFECPVLVENDANLAALSESVLGAGRAHGQILYITLSTGIGTGFITDGQIDPSFAPVEGGFMYLNFEGREEIWEQFASGKAFTERYGKMGSEVEDPAIWKEYASTLAAGFLNLIVIVEPDLVVVGGGMGAHFKKYEKFLLQKLDELRAPLHTVAMPTIVVAEIPEDAVIYGGFLIAKKAIDDSIT